jgi:circadian clock protein KaiC
MADTWIKLSYHVHGGERNRGLSIVKSRGSRHSNQVREVILSDVGITLTDVYTAGGEVLMGTARWQRESAEHNAEEERTAAVVQHRLRLESEIAAIEANTSMSRREIDLKRAELAHLSELERQHAQQSRSSQATLREMRRSDEVDAPAARDQT